MVGKTVRFTIPSRSRPREVGKASGALGEEHDDEDGTGAITVLDGEGNPATAP
jgi:hypothetical protein